jgi:membrane glycosyltransferase
MPSIIADSTQVTMPIYREQLDKMLSRLQDQMAQMKQTTKPGQKSSASQN